MKMKKNIFIAVLLSLAFGTVSRAADSVKVPPLPRTLANARFVYVTANDGDQFDPQLMPEDRDAIARVEDGIRKWGKLIVVYQRQEADIVLAVQSRSSEDVLAVYDAHGSSSQSYLWRVMERGGLRKGEMPLLSQFERAWEKIAN